MSCCAPLMPPRILLSCLPYARYISDSLLLVYVSVLRVRRKQVQTSRDKQTDRQARKQTDRQAQKQIDRQAQKQTDRQGQKQTDRQISLRSRFADFDGVNVASVHAVCRASVRPKSEFQRRTMHGAVVSLLLGVLVNLLIWRELRFSMQTETVERLFVNSTIAPEVTVT